MFDFAVGQRNEGMCRVAMTGPGHLRPQSEEGRVLLVQSQLDSDPFVYITSRRFTIAATPKHR